MQAIFDPQAQAEFDDVYLYYNQQKTGLGEDFAESVRLGLRRILVQPESCAIEFGDVRRVSAETFPLQIAVLG